MECVLKKYGEKTDNPSIRKYVSKIENIITFKIKTEYYLELLTTKRMKLLGSIKTRKTKDENDQNLPHLAITEVVLVQCIIVNNDYQKDSRILYTFVPIKSFGQLLDIPPKNFISLKTFDSEFSYTKV